MPPLTRPPRRRAVPLRARRHARASAAADGRDRFESALEIAFAVAGLVFVGLRLL